MTIIAERLAWLEDLELARGGHASRKKGACALEALSYIAGEQSALELVDRMIELQAA